MLKVEGGEIGIRKEEMPKKKKEETDLADVFLMAIGFVLAIYGFLTMVFPQNYPIGNLSTSASQPIGAILLIFGIILVVKAT